MNTKEKLLSALKAGKGTWISGEQLSRQLSVSRAAISKHIRKLREMGYGIESAPKKGYLFESTADILNAAEIGDGLNTKILGKMEIVCLDETDSTNTRAKDLAVQGAPEGTLVLAEKQTMGRGRKGRKWSSPAGDGIYASLILRPVIAPTEAPLVTLLTAVAAAEALLAHTRLTPKIKWPNDILINGKKIAGILTELSMEMDRVDFIIVGLGLNVTTPADGFPEEIKEIATSVFVESGERVPRVKLIQAYLEWYETFYETFQNEGVKPIVDRWKTLSDIIGKRILVDMISKKYTGTVMDVANDGVLILKDDHGNLHRIFSGDVTIV